MRYNSKDLKRQERLMPEERALELLNTCEYGYLSVVTETGDAYGVPINYVWDGKSSIYMHCAPEGRKTDAIASHPQVSFCIVGYVHLLPEKFSTERESVILNGTARMLTTDEEKLEALHLLLHKLSPQHLEKGYKYAESSLKRVAIIRMNISDFCGKWKVLR